MGPEPITADQLASLTLREAYERVVLADPAVRDALEAATAWGGWFDPGTWLRRGSRVSQTNKHRRAWPVWKSDAITPEALVETWFRDHPASVPTPLPESLVVLARAAMDAMGRLLAPLQSGWVVARAGYDPSAVSIGAHLWRDPNIFADCLGNQVFRRGEDNTFSLIYESVHFPKNIAPQSESGSALVKNGGRPAKYAWDELISMLLIYTGEKGHFTSQNALVDWVQANSGDETGGPSESAIREHFRKNYPAYFDHIKTK